MRTEAVILASVLAASAVLVSGEGILDLVRSSVSPLMPPEPQGCIVPSNGMELSGMTRLCNNIFGITYSLPAGIRITSDNSALDCQRAVLRGSGSGSGVSIEGDGVSVKNCVIENYGHGIIAGSGGASIFSNTLSENDVGITANGAAGSSDGNNVLHNRIYSGGIGIALLSSSGNVLFNNSFEGSNLSILFADGPDGFSLDSKIFGNSLSGGGISGANLLPGGPVQSDGYLKTNTFCYNGIGNSYSSGASGPSCSPDAENPVVCSDECSAGGVACSGAGRIECGQFDSDHCLEWSQPLSCPSGTSCSLGTCSPSACIQQGQACLNETGGCCSGFSCRPVFSCESKSCRSAFGNNREKCLAQQGCGWYELNAVIWSYCTGTFRNCTVTSHACAA